jgi:hypothetical protein
LVATPSSTSVALKWNSVTNASGYVVSYGTTSAASAGSVSVASSVTSSTVGNLTPGTLYYFHVQANPAKSGDGFASISSTTTKNATAPSKKITYTIRPGDNWDTLAKKWGVTEEALRGSNPQIPGRFTTGTFTFTIPA